MRILQVIHQFPPFSSQGSEVYCFHLAQQLSRTADVRVFHVSNPPRSWRRGLRRGTHAGLPTYHCIDGGAYARIAAWPNHVLRYCFDEALDEMRPDVVHFHNYLSLGDDLVSRACSSGAAVAYTLHDYGLICPNALLLRDDGVLCGKADGDFFQDCCPVLIRSGDADQQRRPLTARLPSLARWQMFSRQQTNPVVRPALATLVGAAVRLAGDPRVTHVDEKRTFFLKKTRQIFRDVDLFIAPSRFLLERYVSCGVSPDRIVHMRNGMRLFTAPPRVPRSGPLRVGYIGSLHPQKGLELLLEAFREVGHGATLHVHGSAFNSPISASYWSRVRGGAADNVVFHGAYENERVCDILAGLDVIVVPSVWYENSPLTISEAFMAGVPVITANAGGMAELVQHGQNGLTFRLGDAADLRARLQEVLERPELLDDLRPGIPTVTGIEQHSSEMLSRYRELLARRSPPHA